MNIDDHKGQSRIGSHANGGALFPSIALLAAQMNRSITTKSTDGTAPMSRIIDPLAAVVRAASIVEKQLSDQAERIAKLEKLVVTDELTGLLNRRGFRNQIDRSLAIARRYQETGVLIYIDLDKFKPINDTHGHAAGDAVLVSVARTLSDNIRDADYVGRLGGDEFGVVLTRTDPVGGLARAEALGKILNSTVVSWGEISIPVQASLGFLGYGPTDDSDMLIMRADDAMYKIKQARSGQSQRLATV